MTSFSLGHYIKSFAYPKQAKQLSKIFSFSKLSLAVTNSLSQQKAASQGLLVMHSYLI